MRAARDVDRGQLAKELQVQEMEGKKPKRPFGERVVL